MKALLAEVGAKKLKKKKKKKKNLQEKLKVIRTLQSVLTDRIVNTTS